MLTVADIAVIRHKVVREGRSQRAVARELGISRQTVRRYLDASVVPGVRVERGPRAQPVRAAVEEAIHRLLEEAPTTRKQRLTAPRVVELLAAQGRVASPRTVRRVMAAWRRSHQEVFVPLIYRPGELAEVDFFAVEGILRGERVKGWLFTLRLMYSGRDFAWLYPWADQTSFLDGHVRAFAHFGGVPQRIVYDNLKAAVRKVLVGSERELSPRFAALVADYVFEPRFARLYTGHDKGGVEARGKGIRWQHLTPLPAGDTWGAIAEALLARLDQALERPRRRGSPSIAALWRTEQPHLLALPAHPHDPGILHRVRVGRQAKVRIRGGWYSVPCGWHGLEVKAWVYPERVVLRHDGGEVVHPRVGMNGASIRYRHYLPELAHKPQALEQVAPALLSELGEPFDTVWQRLVAERGRLGAARLFKRVLQAVVDDGEAAAARRLRQALADGRDPLLALAPETPVPAALSVPPRLSAIPIAAASLAAYDALLPAGAGGEVRS